MIISLETASDLYDLVLESSFNEDSKNVAIELIESSLDYGDLKVFLESNCEPEESLLNTFYQHIIKTACQPIRFGTSWVKSIYGNRDKVWDIIFNTNKRRNLSKSIPKCYERGRKLAINEIEDHDPEACERVRRYIIPEYLLTLKGIFDNDYLENFIRKSISDLPDYYKKKAENLLDNLVVNHHEYKYKE